jgi:hypothetical protein
MQASEMEGRLKAAEAKASRVRGFGGRRADSVKAGRGNGVATPGSDVAWNVFPWLG